jgi:hypothetical protein
VLDGAVLAHIADVVCTRERVAELRSIADERGVQLEDPAKVWRRLITHDHEVGRAYSLHMIESVVVDGSTITITAKARGGGRAEAAVSKLLVG